ncbi:MAG: TonB-dependent receptor, partial [Acidobacteria bacterium]|nr:TonB-dependent receptor [Acidobacteriota bacterium]
NHSLRFGGEFRILQENNYNYGAVSPHIAFDQAWTRGPMDNSPTSPIGEGLASFLLGLPTGGYVDRNPSYAEQSGYTALFLQDDWRISRKLTINMGLRWEYEMPTTERYNRTNRGFDFTTPNPISAAALANYAKNPAPALPVSQFRTLGGLLFSGVDGQPRGLFNGDPNNFAPRVGIAYQIRPRTVLRAGYGIFFDSIGADQDDVAQQGYSQRTNLTPSLDNGLSFHATLNNPFPDGLLAPAGASAGLATFLGRSPSFFWPTRKAGYVQRWSFNIQHELPGRALVEIGYVGNRGTGLGVAQDLNAVPAQYLSTSPVRDQGTIDFLTQAVTNPFYGLPQFDGSGMQGRTVALSQLLKPYPEFAAINSTLSGGSSWYHSLQIRAEKRMAYGFTIQGSYTWSKFMEAIAKLNDTDTRPEHVVSPQDRPHHLIMSGIYELPFGRGKHFLSQGGLINHILGGWSVQGIYQAQSGPPIGFGNIVFYGNIQDIVKPRSERTVEQWFNTGAGFETDPRKALGQNLRTFPSKFTGLRADGFNNFDFSVFKTFPIHERLKFQLRAEAQDAFNHAMFAAPNTAPANTLFGSVNAIVGTEQRRISIVGKLNW